MKLVTTTQGPKATQGLRSVLLLRGLQDNVGQGPLPPVSALLQDLAVQLESCLGCNRDSISYLAKYSVYSQCEVNRVPVLEFRDPGADFENNFRARNEAVSKGDCAQDQGGRELGRQCLGHPTLGPVRKRQQNPGSGTLSTRE